MISNQNQLPFIASSTLHDLVLHYGLPAVLRTLAAVMQEQGAVTGGIVTEAAQIEEWLTTRETTRPE